MAVAITCGYGGYLLPLLAAHSSFFSKIELYIKICDSRLSFPCRIERSVFPLDSVFETEPPRVDNQAKEIYDTYIRCGKHGAEEPSRRSLQMYREYHAVRFQWEWQLGQSEWKEDGMIGGGGGWWLSGNIKSCKFSVKLIYSLCKNTWSLYFYIHIIIDQWVSARLQYLQCITSGDTAVLH